MLTTGFVDAVLVNPSKDSNNNTLYILSSVASPEMVSWTINKLNAEECKQRIRIILLVGMAAEGISERAHTEFIRLHGKQFGNVLFECSYIDRLPYCNVNLFLWKNDNTPTVAFLGSPVFTQSSMLFPAKREVINQCCAYEADAFISSTLVQTIYCNHNEVSESIRITNKHTVFDVDIEGDSANTVIIPLLTNKGTVATRSGLNWGQRQGRNPNQAYVRLPAKVAQTGFFPLDRQFIALTDDNKEIILRVEQEGNKAITTPDSNALIGEYFRNRLGVENGGLITVQHLHDYGRTSVKFIKVDDNTYYMDFSKPVK